MSTKRMFQAGGAVALLLAATGFSIYFAGGTSTAVAAGHDHAAMTAADSARPVTLTVEQADRIGVTYATAIAGPLTREIRIVGQVTFDETRVRTISPKVEGWVEQLHVNYTGQPVAQGQPLLTIYSPMLVAAQEELLLAVRLTKDVEGASADARASASELLGSARRRLAYWDVPATEIAAIERSGEVRRAITLRAPYGGHVLEKNVLAGQKIMMGDALYKVAELGTIWVEGEVFEQDLAAVRLGQQVTAELDAMPGHHQSGRITYIYPTVNPETRTARVRVELPNPTLELKPGMYATLKVNAGAAGHVLSVPRGAVLGTGRRNVVFVRRGDGVLEPRTVTVGAANDDRVAILAGLSAGETVVASATFLVDAESSLGSLAAGAGPGTAAAAGDPHAGHEMPAAPAPADPHAGHVMPAAPAPADPHAGHRM